MGEKQARRDALQAYLQERGIGTLIHYPVPPHRQQAYAGLMANRRAVLPGLGIKVVPFLLRLFPRSFILAAVYRFQLRNR